MESTQVQILGYNDSYRIRLLEYLRGSAAKYADMSNEQLDEWLDTRVNYKWIDDVDINQYPYKYGLVLVDGEEIVGYLGLIYSYIYACDEKKIFVNPVSWSIKKKYGFYLFAAMNMILESADVIGEFTPSDVVRKMCLNMYHFDVLDDRIIKFWPKPVSLKGIHTRNIEESNEIYDESSRVKYIDNIKFGVRCMEFEINNRRLYVFYKRRSAKVKKIFKAYLAIILDISDYNLFNEYFEFIICGIQRGGNYFVDVEGRFISDADIEGKYKCKIFKNNKLVLSKVKLDHPLGLLYSEVAFS